MNSYLVRDTDTRCISAEVKFTTFLIEHNVPLAAADHAGPLFRSMFPDSQTASLYGCGRTKTTAIVKALSQESANAVTNNMISGPFSMATDGSNDGSASTKDQLYPIIIRYVDPETGLVKPMLLSMPACKGNSTGRSMNVFRIENS